MSQRRFFHTAWLSALMLLVMPGCLSQPSGTTPVRSTQDHEDRLTMEQRDLSRFLDHLKSQHPGESWVDGPRALAGRALALAYPGSRFYVVCSPRPMPSGARPPGRTAPREDKDVKPRQILSLCVRVDAQGRLEELQQPSDYDRGLISITGEEEARLASAAILSTLAGIYFGPAPVEAAQVQVEKTGTGWTCRFRTSLKEGKVVFDARSKCVSASMRYVGPFPG